MYFILAIIIFFIAIILFELTLGKFTKGGPDPFRNYDDD